MLAERTALNVSLRTKLILIPAEMIIGYHHYSGVLQSSEIKATMIDLCNKLAYYTNVSNCTQRSL